MSILHPDLLTADEEGPLPVRIVRKDESVEGVWGGLGPGQ